MNAGAYGGEMKDVLRRVQAVNSQGELVTFAAQEMELAYRSSVFQHNGHVVLEAELELVPGDPLAIQEKMDDFNRRRREKQPLEAASAGSTFKRPKGAYAAKLIESCNLANCPGRGSGFRKTLRLYNQYGQATAQDIYDLIRKVQAEVEKRHNVRLEPEVKIWGEFRDTR